MFARGGGGGGGGGGVHVLREALVIIGAAGELERLDLMYLAGEDCLQICLISQDTACGLPDFIINFKSGHRVYREWP